MTLRLSDDEADALRRRAARESRSMQDVARPQSTAFGADAYPSLEEKAAALLHSLVRNRALVDGNKRLSLAGTIVFLGVNGRRLTLSNDQAYELIIAARLKASSEPR